MIPELGHFALILSLCVALAAGILPLVGAYRNQAQWIAFARPATSAIFVLILVSYACLTWAFYVDDFSVAYVAGHSNSQMPTIFRLSAVWGGHEGSLLLWALMLAGWAIAVATFSRQLPDAMVARVLGVMGLVMVGLLAFTLFTSNPFERLMPAPAEGRSLNPLLQDFGLLYHPPLLYMGYVGLSVAFAFAIAALLAGQLDAAWARWSRPWTIAAWAFLTLGNSLGSWWAYYELGWGGWWFWDPVENASFMPWLLATALIHSLAVTEKRGSFKNWTVLLAIAAFSLTLLGTFLVRSGVLTSVHAFATDPGRGMFILIFLTFVIGSSLLLFAIRAPKVGLGGRFALVSRETLLLLNNVLLVVACGAVFLGTIYPLLIDALGMGKISVGPPYFNAVFIPLMLPVLALVALGPTMRWKQSDLKADLLKLWPAAVVGVAVGVATPLLASQWHSYAALLMALVGWIVAAIVLQTYDRLKAGKPTASWWGMQLAHFGLAVFVVGATMISVYDEERDVRMEPGDTVAVGGHVFKFLGVRAADGPNFSSLVGSFEVSKEGQPLSMLYPEKRDYGPGHMPMTEAAIDGRFTYDLYVSLGEPLTADKEGGPWAVRVYYKPFAFWIWGGCLFMALGGFIAMADRRYRLKLKPRPAAVAVGAAA
ncbi:MAG: heme lyase CcmF/NrfE family subunit [Sulfuritalea sp.]|nr:heme lyase CcmF/NrfE family subunit [Sulfuritalea sp.]